MNGLMALFKKKYQHVFIHFLHHQANKFDIHTKEINKKTIFFF